MEQRPVVKERWQGEEARERGRARVRRRREIEKEKRAELWKERESTERVEERKRDGETRAVKMNR